MKTKNKMKNADMNFLIQIANHRANELVRQKTNGSPPPPPPQREREGEREREAFKIPNEHNSTMKLKHQISHLLSFKRAIMPAASAGETCDRGCDCSVGLCKFKLPKELILGVAGREESGETTDGGYQDCEVTSCGRG